MLPEIPFGNRRFAIDTGLFFPLYFFDVLHCVHQVSPNLMPPELPRQHPDGLFSFMLAGATCKVLAHILDPSIPFVWVRDHGPVETVRWWKTRIPLSESGRFYDAEVRNMGFDLHFTTSRFLELLPEFERHGMLLYQLTRRLPHTLTLNRVREEAVTPILLQNGLHLQFNLPHAIECAQLSSPRREVLEALLTKPEIGEMVY